MTSSRRGAAAVEFALTMPVLLVMIFGVLDLSWYIRGATAVVNATREGLRMGVTVAQEDGPDAMADEQIQAVLLGYGIDCEGAYACEIEVTSTQVDGLDALTANASISFLPLVGLTPAPELVRATLTMALEDQGT